MGIIQINQLSKMLVTTNFGFKTDRLFIVKTFFHRENFSSVTVLGPDISDKLHLDGATRNTILRETQCSHENCFS